MARRKLLHQRAGWPPIKIKLEENIKIQLEINGEIKQIISKEIQKLGHDAKFSSTHVDSHEMLL